MTDLWAVVNNAGVVQLLGPDDWMNFEAYTSTIDVNTFGAMRVIRVNPTDGSDILLKICMKNSSIARI